MIDLTRQPSYDPEVERRFVAEGVWTDDVLGDRGFIAETGYLKLIGRIKDIINRGATKINPSDI